MSYFLFDALGRLGLTTYINAQARNIIFENRTTAGVNITNHGMIPFTNSARKEVTVSAGAWHSPRLLIVSGIGPKAILHKFHIGFVKNLPGVGQNTWDSTDAGGPVSADWLPLRHE